MSELRRRFVAQAVTTPPVESTPVPIDVLDAEFAVHCPRTLLDRLMVHAMRYGDREVFGLLLGRAVSMDGQRTRTVIADFVPAETFLESRRSYVEVSAEELLRMHDASEARMKADNLRTVGWFHTHPGHGIFMSGIDRENHRLYTHPWQVALVIDPKNERWGFFVTSDCRPVSQDLIVVDTESTPSSVEKPPDDPEVHTRPTSEPVAEQPPSTDAPTEVTGTTPKPRRWMGILPSCIVAVGALSLVMAMVLLNAKLVAQQALLEEENARIKDLQLSVDDLAKKVCVPR